MPIITEAIYRDIKDTYNEYAVYNYGEYNYMFSEIEGTDITVIDILKKENRFETGYMGSLSIFWTSEKYPMIDLAYISEEYQGQGVMPILYEFLIEHFGCVISDTQMTENAYKMWQKLSKKYILTEEHCDEDSILSPTRFILKKG